MKKNLNIKIEECFLKDYKEQCEKLGVTLSKRLRKLMEEDIKQLEKGNNIFEQINKI